MPDDRAAIVDVLRGRLLRALHAGALEAGDRLPSARDAAGEFGVDYRVIIEAYRELERERLVELRPRGGVYVAARAAGMHGVPPLPEEWMADVLAQGLAREIPGPELHEWLRRATETLRLRAVVVATTADQGQGLCRELRDDFGLEVDALEPDEIRASDVRPLPLRRADLVVTTEAHESWLAPVAADLRKALVVVSVRPELRGGEWMQLMRRPVYVVVASREFGEMLHRYYADVPNVENLHVLVLGDDDLGMIPEGAPTYITQHARAGLGDTPIRGRLLPAARTIASESAREIFRLVVRVNLEAMGRRGG